MTSSIMAGIKCHWSNCYTHLLEKYLKEVTLMLQNSKLLVVTQLIQNDGSLVGRICVLHAASVFLE